jgi:hypothetical protein
LGVEVSPSVSGGRRRRWQGEGRLWTAVFRAFTVFFHNRTGERLIQPCRNFRLRGSYKFAQLVYQRETAEKAQRRRLEKG